MIYRLIMWLFKREVYNIWKEEKRLLDLEFQEYERLWKEEERQEHEEYKRWYAKDITPLLIEEQRRYERYGDKPN